MPRTGATFNLVTNDFYPAVEATVIDPDASNEMLEDLATGLTNSLARDGSGGMTGNLPMNSYKLTGLAAGSTNGDSVRFEQVQAVDATLTAFGALTFVSDSMFYATGADTFAVFSVTAGGRAALGVAGVNNRFLRYTGASSAEAFDLYGTAGTWTATQTGSRWAIDSNFYMEISASQPLIALDSGDYLTYDRASNILSFGVGSASKVTFYGTGEIVPADAGATQTLALGYRGSPVNTQDGDYTLVLTDNGKMVRHTSGSAHAHTIPPVASVAFPVGNTMVRFRNTGAGAVTITRGAGVTLRIAGLSTDQDVTLAQWGDAVATMEASNTWVISGTGIS